MVSGFGLLLGFYGHCKEYEKIKNEKYVSIICTESQLLNTLDIHFPATSVVPKIPRFYRYSHMYYLHTSRDNALHNNH
jgi:hypothetical protein